MSQRGGGGDRSRGRGGDDRAAVPRGGRGGGYEAAARGGAGAGDRGGRGGNTAGGRGSARGGGSSPAVSTGLKIETIAATSLPQVSVSATQPHLFGGSRQQALQNVVKATNAIEAQGNREKLDARRKAINDALGTVPNIPAGNAAGSAATFTPSNFFPVECSLDTSFLQYDAALEPEVGNPRIRRALVTRLLAEQSARLGVIRPVYKNRIVFAPRALHDASAGNTVVLRQEENAAKKGWMGKSYTLTLKHTRDIRQEKGKGLSTEYYTVITSIIAEAFEEARLVKISGKMFDVEGTFTVQSPLAVEGDPFGTLQLMEGLNVVLHPTARGLLLNVDLTFRTTRSSTVLDHIRKLRDLEKSKKDEEVRRTITDDLVGAMMVTTYLHERRRQTFVVSDVLHNLTPQSPIPGLTPPITIAQYMKQNHNIDVCPQQPILLAVSKKEVDKEGNPKKSYFLPELAKFAGQSTKMRANAALQQELKRHCLIDSTTRFNTIFSIVKKLTANNDFQRYLTSWGITIVPKMVAVATNTLKPVAITTAGRELRVNMERRSWLLSRGGQLERRAKESVKEWAVVQPDNISDAEMKHFVDCLLKETINGLGGGWPEPYIVKYRGDRNPATCKRNLERCLGEQVAETTEFLLVVLPDNCEEPYTSAKTITLQGWQIPSQCVLRKNVINERNVLNVASRVGGQMLVKQGASLWTVDATELPDTIICGVDYASTATKREVVALAAFSTTGGKMDFLGSYHGFSKKNAVSDLLRKAIHDYQSKFRAAPKNVVVYRAGMDEGDIPRIVEEEVLGVVEECSKQKMGVTYLASLKRCHARFLAPPIGFVVDADILPRAGFSFLLVPQQCNIGTATAMKFSVLANTIPQIKQSGAVLEAVTFKLCHMFFGWWATTREPAVVMYASRQAELIARLDPTKALGPTGAQGPQAF